MYKEAVGLSGVPLKRLNEHQLLPVWEIKHISFVLVDKEMCFWFVFYDIPNRNNIYITERS